MKPLVIYHDNCADGFGAAFAARLRLGSYADYLPMQHGGVPEVLAAFREGDILRVVEFLDEGREDREVAVFLAPTMWMAGAWPAAYTPMIHASAPGTA